MELGCQKTRLVWELEEGFLMQESFLYIWIRIAGLNTEVVSCKVPAALFRSSWMVRINNIPCWILNVMQIFVLNSIYLISNFGVGH